MKKLLFLCLCLLLLAVGCSSHHTGINDEGGAVVWTGDKKAMLKALRETMESVFPGRDIYPIGEEGCYTWQRMLMDKYTHRAILVRVRAVDKDDTREWYSIDVSGEGTIFNGPSKNQALYDAIITRFNASFQKR